MKTQKINKARKNKISANLEQLECRTLMTVTPTLAAPTLLVASPQGTGQVNLTWKDNAVSSTTGYYIFRSSDGKIFSQIDQLSSADAHNYADSTVQSGARYSYKIEAHNDTLTSAFGNVTTATTTLAAPSGGAVQQDGAWVDVSWIGNDNDATAYMILRSTNAGKTYTTIGKATGVSTLSYTDHAAGTGQGYVYEVQASDAVALSAVSNAASITTPMVAPSALTATPVKNTSVTLAWKDNDSSAAGYYVMRSTDQGNSYSQLAKITNGKTASYVDNAVTAGNSYLYKVEAYNTLMHSDLSAAATGTLSPNVAITTRYGDETIVTAIGSADTIVVDQAGSMLNITADGSVDQVSATAGGLFVYLRGGKDSVTVDSDVTTNLTIDGIDGVVDTVNSASATVGAWLDSTDIFSGQGLAHKVINFAGNVGKSTGAALANPKDSGATHAVTGSLWGTGPVAGDINQGEIGDCYFLSTLAAFAGTKPATLENSAVDLGDGTFAVQFIKNNVPTFVRVSNAMPNGGFEAGLKFEHPGTTGDIWALVMEKAFAYFRTGANTYASINSGWMGEVYSDLGVSSSFIVPSNYSDDSFYSLVNTALGNADPVTLATSNAPDLVSGHAYTLVGVSTDDQGVHHYQVRNPWGQSGDSLEDAGGYATLTFAQLKANFVAACVGG